MSKLRFDYSMQIRYTTPVSLCHFTIKCIPQDTARQRIRDTEIVLLPRAGYMEGKDSFGNRQIYGSVKEPHTEFSFRISGTAQTGLCDYEEAAGAWDAPMFFHPFGMNRAGDGLRAYFAGIPLADGRSAYETARLLMQRVHRDFSYEKGCTDIATTAEEAWSLGRGVCQDYAHILIALCHQAGIAARYVTGMLIGEGESHAWVEVFSGGKWYGLDPTNNTAVASAHIRIGCGRDASDCQLNRGVMWGGGAQTQQICASVQQEDAEQ